MRRPVPLQSIDPLLLMAIAFVAAAVFLQRNGLRLTASEAEATVAMLRVAEGSLSAKQLARWLGSHTMAE